MDIKRTLTIKEMKALREQGYTYDQIARISGVSKARVFGLIGKGNPAFAKALSEKECIYPALRQWMAANQISRMALTRQMQDGVAVPYFSTRLGRILRGEQEPRKTEIDKLLSITQMTYEQLFAQA